MNIQKLKLLGLFIFLFAWNVNAQMVLEYNTNLSAGTTITLPLNGTVNVSVDWGDSNVESFNAGGNQDHTYAAEGTYTVTITGTLTWFGAYNYPNADKLSVVTDFGDLGLTWLTYAFHNAVNLTSVPETLPVGITNASFMFYYASSFNSDISGWDVSEVNSMASMFSYATLFNSDISGWDVGNVVHFENMFSYAESFNQDISGWDVSSAQVMLGMFQNAVLFNQDIGGWDVALVWNMTNMFHDATEFDQDLSAWNVGNVTDMPGMFVGIALSTENYDALLNGWSALTLQPDVSFHAGNSTYSCIGEEARNILTSEPNNWIITDDGLIPDVTNPVITCVGNQTVNADVTNTYTVNGTEFDPTESYDNCGIASLENDFNSYSSLDGAELPLGTTDIVWTITDNTGNSETCSSQITVNAYSEIETVNPAGISVYPNPANDNLHIDFGCNVILKFIITDLSGKRVYECFNAEENIDISNFKSGIYMIQIYSNNGISTSKLVKE